jgi:HEAT repeat protein
MNLSEVNQIIEIKTEFLSNTEPEIRKRALYTLGRFGNEGIDTIHALIEYTQNDDIKACGLEVITKTKKSLNL